MAEMCTRVPYVGNEESKLFNAIYKYTGKNRRLTALVYATAKQDWFKEKFSPSDYNDQGELLPEKVIAELNLLELVDINAKLDNAKKLLKAVNDEENPVEYSAIRDVIDKVLNFNKSLDNLVAKIQRTGNKYTIDVQIKDDTNFSTYELYQTGKAQFDILVDTLNKLGFNTNFPTSILLSLDYTNPVSFQEYVPSLLAKFQRATTSGIILTTNLTELLLFLLGPNEKLNRLKTKFGDKTTEVIKFLLSNKTEIPEDIEDLKSKITGETLALFREFKKDITSKFAKINLGQLKTALSEQYKENYSSETLELKKTLKDLYNKWNLDKDTLDSTKVVINSLQDANKVIISRLLGNLLFLLSKGAVTSKEGELITKLIKDIERKLRKKEYYDSILEFLKGAERSLRDIEALDVSIIEEGAHNEMAGQILQVENKIKTYAPLIEALRRIDTLEQAEELDPRDIAKVKSLCNSISTLISSLLEDILSKKFTLVYNYLKERWGEDTKSFSLEGRETLGTFEVSLELALKLGKIPMNIIERTFFAMTEVSDPVIATFAGTIKDLHEIRDAKLKKVLIDIRRATDAFLKAGGNMESVFETLPDGTVKMLSEIDWDKYYKAREEYKKSIENKYKGATLRALLDEWEEHNLSEYKPSGIKILKEITGEEEDIDATVKVPNASYRKPLLFANEAQRKYYYTMMSLKASLEYNLLRHGIDVNLFNPVQITSSVTESLGQGSLKDTFKLLKDNFIDNFSIREDDTLYGNLKVLTDANGTELKSLPVHYVNKLGDLKRVSKNLSRALTAFAGMAINYSVMSDHINSLELIKEFLLDREIELRRGSQTLVGSAMINGKEVITPVTRKTRETTTGTWLTEMIDAKVYGRKHQKGKTIKGTSISTDKATDVATRYTSTTGLVMNVPGAIANVLVGKLLMVIEAAGGEFFGFKDYDRAIRWYWGHLPKLLQEIPSNNKTSILGLLMEKFDVLDDFYEQLKETGFYKNGLNKIIGNTSLFFLYGIGEHLLHAQGMLACLNHVKVKDKNGKEVSLLDAFDVEVKDGNGELIIKEGYTDRNGKPIDEKFLSRLKNVIAYVNRSLQGAFGDDEKGWIHLYAFGRLVMNFRLWMPAHYARRFNKLHWDATLGDFREGYYYTCWKFAGSLLADIKQHLFNLATRYKNLDDMQKANLRRALAETMILVALAMLSRLGFGDDPKHRTKAEAMLKYEIKRMYMETAASNPVSILSKGDFFTNIWKTINDPIAAIAPALRLTRLFGIEDLILMKTVQSGPHEGELVYLRNLLKAIPFYDLVYKWWNIDTDNSMFLIFNLSY